MPFAPHIPSISRQVFQAAACLPVIALFWVFLGVVPAFAQPVYVYQPEEMRYRHFSSTFYLDGQLYPTTKILYKQPFATEYSYEHLVKDINTKNLTTIGDVIAQLPEYMRTGNFLVVYHSRSLQTSSPEAPRIVAFSPSARLMLAFNSGDKKYSGHDKLEVIQWREQTNRFEFREISFAKNKRPVFSKADPKQCIRCHQARGRQQQALANGNINAVDMRPNWEPYSHWPGVIGSNDGDIRFALKDSYDFNRHIAQPYDETILQDQAREADIARNFMQKIAPENARYRHLRNLDVTAPLRFTDLVAVHNFHRVMRLMQQQAQVFAAHLDLFRHAVDCGLENIAEVIKNYPLFPGKNPSLTESQRAFSLSRLITRVFESFGVDTSDWSMNFDDAARFAFVERLGTPSNTMRNFRFAFHRMMTTDHSGRDWLAVWQKCREDNQKIKKQYHDFALLGATQARFQQAVAQSQASKPRISQVLAKCMHCHDGSELMTPAIPFDQGAEKLRSVLVKKADYSERSLYSEILLRTGDLATLNQQMPPKKRLRAEERRVLHEYLKEVMRVEQAP